MREIDRTASTGNGRLREEGGLDSVSKRRGLDRRGVLRATGGGALGVALSGCLDVLGVAGSDEGSGPIRIGVLGPDPRRDPMGRSISQTAQLAAEQWNDEGGLLGRDVEVVTGDTKGSPLEARRAYHKLILDDNVDVTMGITESLVMEHLLDEIAKFETLHFTTGATGYAATDRIRGNYDLNRFHFRTMLNDNQLVGNLYQAIAELFPQIGWESAAVIGEAYPWTEQVVDAFAGEMPNLGVEVTMHRRYPPQIDSFVGMYEEIETTGADAAWVAMAHTGDEALLDWAREQPSFGFAGIHVPMQLPTYWEIVNGACEYAMTTQSATAESDITPVTTQYATDYQQAFDGELPVYTGYLTYNALLLYKEAVEAADSFEEDDVIEQLLQLDLEGTTGEFSFHGPDDPFPHDPAWDPEDPESPGSILVQWQGDGSGGGTQEVIWPNHIATADYQTPSWI